LKLTADPLEFPVTKKTNRAYLEGFVRWVIYQILVKKAETSFELFSMTK
jgi:hypothetical protein